MKRLLLFIASIIYITSATGASINLHQCMGKLVDWSFVKMDQRECGKCGMEKADSTEKKCCKEEQKMLKLEQDQSLNFQSIKLASDAGTAVPVLFYESSENGISTLVESFPVSNAPPVTGQPGVYILNCTFLI